MFCLLDCGAGAGAEHEADEGTLGDGAGGEELSALLKPRGGAWANWNLRLQRLGTGHLRM